MKLPFNMVEPGIGLVLGIAQKQDLEAEFSPLLPQNNEVRVP